MAAAVIWWGALYPELTLISDTYEIVGEEQYLQAEDDIHRILLETDKNKIRYRSWLLMQLEEIFRGWKQNE